MDKCRLVIIHHWSLIITTIITFAIFWVQNASSASVQSNNDIPHNFSTTDKIIESSLLLGSSSSLSSFTGTATDGAGAVVESFCSHQTEFFFQRQGKKSSLIFELKSNSIVNDQCKRYLTAPESHGFFIRLIRSPKIKKLNNQSNTATVGWRRNFHGIKNHKLINSSYSCPLSIISGAGPSTPWKIDPCQIEINNDIDEPVRLLSGHLKIVWDHRNHNPSSYLMITLLGKGEICEKYDNVHPCLKFGGETLLCISKDLICDGIHHCPKGSEYDSDEDYDMCAKYKKNIYGDYDSEAWEHLTIEIFRNLFNTEHIIIPPTSSTTTKIKSTTTIKSTMTKVNADNNNDNINSKKKSNNNHNYQNHRNITHGSFTGDLSKYGPWGYLMLGMLLCGAALLICGLWECCCRQNKSDDTTLADSNGSLDNTNADVLSTNETQHDIQPPSYDDLDPPPPYSVLFPNQKLLENGSSSTTQMLSQTRTTTTTTTRPQLLEISSRIPETQNDAQLETAQTPAIQGLEMSAQIPVTPTAPPQTTSQTSNTVMNSTAITPIIINNESFSTPIINSNSSSNNAVNYNDLESR